MRLRYSSKITLTQQSIPSQQSLGSHQPFCKISPYRGLHPPLWNSFETPGTDLFLLRDAQLLDGLTIFIPANTKEKNENEQQTFATTDHGHTDVIIWQPQLKY